MTLSSKNTYILLFFVGLIVAIGASARYEEGIAPLELMSSSGFIIGTTVAVLALILWRRELSVERVSTNIESGSSSAKKLISELITELEKVESQMTTYKREDWLSKLLLIQENYILKFNESRDQINMDANLRSDLLLSFAYGERLINRTYSCCLDGYPDEGLSLIPNAIKSFKKCFEYFLQ